MNSGRVDTKTNEKGQALVEFALILPLLILIFFGIIECGRAFFQKNMTVNASREGARFAAVQDTWDVGKITIAATNPIVPESLKISSTVVIDPHSRPSPGGSVKVTVTTKFNSLLPKLLIPLENYTDISASTTMQYEQNHMLFPEER